MESDGQLTPSTLSTKDLPWQILWSKEKCTLCGRCTAVCPVRAIELGVHRKRVLQVPWGCGKTRQPVFGVYHGIRQRTDAGPRLHRLRDVRHGLSQRRDHADPQRRTGQAALSHQSGRRSRGGAADAATLPKASWTASSSSASPC